MNLDESRSIGLKERPVISVLLFVFAAVLLASLAAHPAICIANRQPGSPPIDQMVVFMRANAASDLKELLRATAGDVIYHPPQSSTFVLQVPTKSLAELRELIAATRVHPRVTKVTFASYTPQDSSACAGAKYPIDEVVVVVKDDVGDGEVIDLAAAIKGTVIGFSFSTNAYTIRVPTKSDEQLSELLDQLRRDERIITTSRNVKAGVLKE